MRDGQDVVRRYAEIPLDDKGARGRSLHVATASHGRGFINLEPEFGQHIVVVSSMIYDSG